MNMYCIYVGSLKENWENWVKFDRIELNMD